MRLPFVDRAEEFSRLRRTFASREGRLVVLYGRRRCGKSRLLEEVLPRERTIYVVGDDREAPLQRRSVAREISRLLPGFDQVAYPEWEALLERFWAEAPQGTVLAIDEFPALVAVSRDLPSLLQKLVDRSSRRGIHLVLAGSSQRLMQGIVLDRRAPLFGRAHEILEVRALEAGWIQKAMRMRTPVDAIEAFSVWGGVPRYWELAADYEDLRTAIRELVLNPLGVLHDEPRSLLLDDLRDTTQAASILSLVGQGVHRLSEIAGRLEKPTTSLSRPLQRLVDLGFVQREQPFGVPPRGSKRTLYRIQDPFLRFWFRFVEPNRSRLEARQISQVQQDIEKAWAHHVGTVWEDLARTSVPRLLRSGTDPGWTPASRWWGGGRDRRPLEVDVVAESEDQRQILLGEVKWSDTADPRQLARELRGKAQRSPFIKDRTVRLALWLKQPTRAPSGVAVHTPTKVLRALR